MANDETDKNLLIVYSMYDPARCGSFQANKNSSLEH
jgi:hypothetical protein